ncbi:hypothetical protein BpHYR1_021727 [Brachionus plicatilis]|uniref:Uncharacterized protein n=1 Tax=Brachionus plicatilis TaxID=10195 RepID=A0A3M7PX85_BRAPC|nr:hypothetical protein BpHYR1_021727 [Brachionus plicatilis]
MNFYISDQICFLLTNGIYKCQNDLIRIYLEQSNCEKTTIEWIMICIKQMFTYLSELFQMRLRLRKKFINTRLLSPVKKDSISIARLINLIITRRNS